MPPLPGRRVRVGLQIPTAPRFPAQHNFDPHHRIPARDGHGDLFTGTIVAQLRFPLFGPDALRTDAENLVAGIESRFIGRSPARHLGNGQAAQIHASLRTQPCFAEAIAVRRETQSIPLDGLCVFQLLRTVEGARQPLAHPGACDFLHNIAKLFRREPLLKRIPHQRGSHHIVQRLLTSRRLADLRIQQERHHRALRVIADRSVHRILIGLVELDPGIER